MDNEQQAGVPVARRDSVHVISPPLEKNGINQAGGVTFLTMI